ncbi:MAG: ATP-grasp domain-containing protein, partial [Actinomycetota bacterium]
CPMAMSDEYPDWLEDTVEQLGVDLVFPTLDVDLDRFLASEALLDRPVALNSPRALAVSRDKAELDRRLVAADEPARIPSASSADFAELRELLGLPFLLKPRRGHGSRGIVSVADEDDFAPYAGRLPDELLAQQHVGDADEEYTVGAFGDGEGGFCARIAMRRWLFPHGPTSRVEVVEVSPDLEATLGRLATILDPRGPTNLQFRRTEGGWRLLEVNARVSSTTSLRERFGYPESTMTVDHYLEGRVPAQPTIRAGSAVRYLEDLVLP